MHKPVARAANVLQKIKTVTAELEHLQHEICSLVDSSSPDEGALPGGGADVCELRAALDQLRRVLWFYLEEISAHKPAEKLLPQAVEPAALEPPPSFFDRLNLVIEGYMQTRRGFDVLKRKPAATEPWRDDGRGWQSSIRSRTQAG